MHIAFLTHNYPRFEGDVSGSFLATLAAALCERGHHVQIIAPSDAGTVGPGVLDGIPVHRVRYASPSGETLAYRGTMAAAARSPLGAWRALQLVLALRRAAARAVVQGAEVVHAHWWIPAGLAAPSTAPLVVTVHGTDAVLLGASGLARFLARPVFRRARVVTAVSASAAEAIAAASGRQVSGSHLQPMPVETSRFQTWSSGGGGMVAVARLMAQKRIDLAIRAIALLPESLGPLTVVGDGPERRSLEALAAQLGLGARIRFLGAQPPGRVAELLATADLGLFPARNEGFGLAAAESFMAGVPVVACEDGGGVLAVVPANGAGRRVRPEPSAFAEGILAIVADPGARGRARAEGVRWRAALTPGHVAEVCEGWYREALGV